MKLRERIRSIPYYVRYILILFLATRVILSIIGVRSRQLMEPYVPYYRHWIFTDNKWLDIWGIFDSAWYMKIASVWYPDVFIPGRSQHAFFPLYPILVKWAGKIFDSHFLGGIIVSNIFLIVTGIFLYKLVRMEHDEEKALRSVKYLFVFPSAFILSAFFPQSLLLALVIMCIYFAKRRRWLYCGATGFLSSLAHPVGAVIVLPALYEYLKLENHKVKRSVLHLFLIPLGPLIFCIYNYVYTGNFFAYVDAQVTGWGARVINPLILLRAAFSVFDAYLTFFIVVTTVLLLFSSRRVGFSLWLSGLLFMAAALVCGNIRSIMRYMLQVFPIYIVLADIGRNRYLDQAITFAFILLQGALMVFWSSGFFYLM